MSTIDTVHTNRERLKKIASFIEHAQRIGKFFAQAPMPDHPGEVRKLMRGLRCEGDTLVEFANESEACLKALLIQDFIENVELPKGDTITVPRFLWDMNQSALKALREQVGISDWEQN
jgi:hypothetical protein